VQNNTLKLNAQLYPLQKGEDRSVTLHIKSGDKLQSGDQWMEIASSQVHPDGWMATFRVEGWDSTRKHNYQVTHSGGSRYAGTIRRDPVDQDEIVVVTHQTNGPAPGCPSWCYLTGQTRHQPPTAVQRRLGLFGR
jgi:hypothetical protein